MTLLIAIFSQFIILQSFSGLEQQTVRLDVARTTSVVSSEVSDLDNKVSNYVDYGEIYNFVQNLNQNSSSSVVDSGYASLRLNLLLFINSSGTLVSGVAYDLQSDSQVPLPQDIINEITSNESIFNSSELGYSVDGVLSLPQGSMLIASRTILTETPQGPIRGALVAVRYLDSVEASYVSQAVNLPVEFFNYNDPQPQPGYPIGLSSSGADSPFLLLTVNSSTVEGYTSVNDIYGKPGIIVGVEASSDIFSQGQSAVNLFVIAIIGVSGLFLMATAMLMERTVLSRLTGLTKDVKEIGRPQSSKSKVKETGNDELSELSVAINGMLSEIDEKTARLQKAERFAAIGELAAMVGHDLRNPLTGIKNASYYLKKRMGASMGEKEWKVMALIDEDLDYSNKIITDLLDYSREIRLNLKDTDLKTLVNGAISMINVPENVNVINSVGEEQTIAIDADKIKRLFINLITNAIDAMPDGGTVTVDCGKDDKGFKMRFSDTGTGMTSDTLKKLWTPLFTTKAKGMGLGLPICKRIAEAHGGTISVESEEGKGATFTVSLPLTPKEGGGESE